MKILSITFREDVSEIGVLQPPTFFTIIFSSVESSCIIFHKIPGTLRYAFSAIALVLSPSVLTIWLGGWAFNRRLNLNLWLRLTLQYFFFPIIYSLIYIYIYIYERELEKKRKAKGQLSNQKVRTPASPSDWVVEPSIEGSISIKDLPLSPSTTIDLEERG